MKVPIIMKWTFVGVFSASILSGCDTKDESSLGSTKSDVVVQDIATVELKPANAVLAAKFTKVTSVRELSTGRILITDEAENQIVLADFRMDNTATIGRQGRGPEEYYQVGMLWPLRGDSSLMYDQQLRRWLLFNGSRIVGPVAPDDDAVRATRGYKLYGADAEHVVARIYPWRRGVRVPDPGNVVRVRRSDGQSETIAQLAPYDQGKPFILVPIDGAAPSPNPVYHMSLIVNDQVMHFPDGWTAIARYNPYRVDWCPPDDECMTGPVLETPRPLSDDDKRAHLAVAEEMLDWPHTSDLSRTREDSWPKLIPPFIEPIFAMGGTTLFPLRDGRLLIERFPMGVPQWTYDVVDRRGVIVGRLTLPRGERIVAIGKSAIYTVARDEFNLQELRRHPWP